MQAETFDVVIVGAGFAGLYQLHRLRQMGLRAHVFEAGDGVGGTWFWNRYPGARCDVESMSYSFSFSPELEQEWTWQEKYATQPELLKYLEHVADRFDLKRDITFGTRVTAASYDEGAHRWTVESDRGDRVVAQFVVMATGCLSVPKQLDVSGVDAFAGTLLHTARWPDEGFDFTGLRVGVIGTGSSGVQCIPEIARQASEVVVFQRTAAFCMDAGNRTLSSDEVASRKAVYPEWRDAQRASSFGVPATPPVHAAMELTDEERLAVYERCWDEGAWSAFFGAFTDILTDKAANETAAEFVRSKIRSIVHDQEVAESLSPRGFSLGAKRPCLDTGYYESFNLPHVSLVDLRKEPLQHVDPTGVQTVGRHIDLDVIVLATGFDALTGALNAIDIRGAGDRTLREAWAAGPVNYLGLMTAGFPNLFTITGPLSPSVRSNMVVSIEQHVDFIADTIEHMRRSGFSEIDATVPAQESWTAHVAEVADGTLFTDADSWYLGANVPGKPRVYMAYVGGVGQYRQICDQIVAEGYRGFRFDGRDAAAPIAEFTDEADPEMIAAP